MEDIKDLTDCFEEFELDFAEKRSSFFNSLTKDQQLLVFCEIVNKLVNAELVNKSSYRGVLYGEFGFDKDAYAKAQLSGFLDLHNSIDADPLSVGVVGSKILALYGIEQSAEDVKKKVEEEFNANKKNDSKPKV